MTDIRHQTSGFVEQTVKTCKVAVLVVCGLWSVVCSLSWAEDGALLTGQLLYSRLTDGTWQIWMTDLATAHRTQLSFSGSDKRYPSWTPDGRAIYCTSNQACFVAPVGTAGPADEQPLLAELWPVKDLIWAPDNTRIAFAKFRTDLIDSANVWVADLTGTERHLLTHEAGIQYNVAWSPDGTQLAYSGGQGYGTYEIYTVNADGTDPRQLTTNRFHEFLPAWSPDGKWIAYTSDTSGNHEIWVMQADGSQAKQLTRSPGLDSRPSWSPDGTRIAFTTNRSGKLEIWVMNTDGSGQQLLEHAAGGVCDPAWR